eukprot:jgi/Botrbrau1/7432/Bobra.0083s0005.1
MGQRGIVPIEPSPSPSPSPLPIPPFTPLPRPPPPLPQPLPPAPSPLLSLPPLTHPGSCPHQPPVSALASGALQLTADRHLAVSLRTLRTERPQTPHLHANVNDD